MLFLTVAPAAPLLERGQRLVFLGDSITQQQIYTRYVMNYFALRYPDLQVTFRNAGISGDDAEGGIMRLTDDVLGAKPNLVSICFGMNDARYGEFAQQPYDLYVAAMTILVIELKQDEVKPVLLTPGCVDPDRVNWMDGNMYNGVLRRYADAVEEIAAQREVPVYDIHTLMLDVQKRAKAADPKFTMIPDSIHPDPPGQLLMAYGLIVALDAETPASGLVIELPSETITPDRCDVDDLVVTDEAISFLRRDQALPAFFDPEALTILAYAPELKDLNRYPLKVTGLAPGKWLLTVEGEDVGAFTADELAAGVDLGTQPGPWRTLGEKVNDINADQERIYLEKRQLSGVFPWIPKPAPEAEVERLALMKKLDEAAGIRDRQVRDLVDDRTWHWSLRPAP
jgi:lysophospholipase L1-like esterase